MQRNRVIAGRLLPALSVAVLTEALGRHNVLKWPETLAEVTDEVGATTMVEIRMVPKWTGGERRTSTDGLSWTEGQRLKWVEGTKVLGSPPEGFADPRRVYPMSLGPMPKRKPEPVAAAAGFRDDAGDAYEWD